MRSLPLCLALGLSLSPGSATAQPEITHWTEIYPAVARIIADAHAARSAFGTAPVGRRSISWPTGGMSRPGRPSAIV